MAHPLLKRIERWFRPRIGALFTHHVRPRRGLSARAKRILLFVSDSVGDMVVSFPAIYALKRARPEWEYGLVISSRNESLVEGLGLSRWTHRYDRGRSTLIPEFVRSVRTVGYDAVLDLLVSPSLTRALLCATAAPRAFRVGLDAGRYTHFYGRSMPVREGDGEHMILHYVRSLSSLGVSDEFSVRGFLPLTEADRAPVIQFLGGCTRGRLVGLVRSSYRESTRWPDEKLQALAERLRSDDAGTRFAIFCVPRERAEGRRLADAVGGQVVPPDGVPAEKLRVVAAFVDACDILVSPDTATVHIASALNVPVVGLYTDRAPRFGQWHPFRIPCRTPTARGGRWVRTITVEEVHAAFCDLWSEVSEMSGRARSLRA